MTTYAEALDCLVQAKNWRKTLSLSGMQHMAKLVGHPHERFRTVHVAGSNGKGSVAWKTAATLSSAGYRVGLYVSPHISCYRERIRINGRLIPEVQVVKWLTYLTGLCKDHDLELSFFELTTTMAFLYFADQEVDVAVIEVGMGGRLDATNIITPEVSVITSISKEHTHCLGSTLEEIAREKAGIIKQDVPLVIGPQTPGELLQSLALKKGSPCTLVTQFPVDYDEENGLVAKAVLRVLSRSFHFSDHHLAYGLAQRPPCRMECVRRENPTVVLDVAHNPDGFARLFGNLKLHYPGRRVRAVVGLSGDKDLVGCVKLLADESAFVHFIPSHSERGAAPDKLLQHLEAIEQGKGEACTTVEQGVERALQEAASREELVVVCGSFYLMGKARAALGIQEPKDWL